MENNNKIKFLYFIIISQFTVAFTPFYFDVILILIYFFITIKIQKFKLNRYLLLPIILFLSFAVIHELRYINNDFAIFPKSLYSDLRPFFFLALSYNLLVGINVSYNLILNILFLNSLINFLFNIIGFIDPDIFRKLVTIIFNKSYIIIQHSENNGFPTSLSYMSSLQGRFCGAYIQPISAGLSSSFIILTIIYLLHSNKFNFKVLIIIFFSLFNGFVSYSTMFHLLPFFISVWYIINKINIYILFSSIIIFILCFLFFLSFVDINEISLLFFTITSGRYSEDGNIAAVLLTKNFNIIDYIFGFDPYSLGHSGKGVGDSGFFIKWISGGIVYIFLYFILLYNALRYYQKKTSDKHSLSLFFNFIFFIFLLVELGTTPFSLPQFSIFFYVVLLLLSKYSSIKFQHTTN